jgi:hypothetical protein
MVMHYSSIPSLSRLLRLIHVQIVDSVVILLAVDHLLLLLDL